MKSTIRGSFRSLELVTLGALVVLPAWAGACGGSSGDARPASSATGATGPGAGGGDGGAAGGATVGGTGGGGGTGGSSGCSSDADCPPAAPICDTQSGSCVECLPGNDPCPDGEFCDGGVCSIGCTDDGDCDGGGEPLVCDPSTNQCVGCVDDASCPPGSICVQEACVPGCNASHACQPGLECCAEECFDTSSDPLHCGGCSACPAPPEAHADAVCNLGVCGFGPCQPGFDDCNGDPLDGCEADLMGQPGCSCIPGEMVDCYTGPVGTEGNGPCLGGKKTCDATGIGFGPCEGEVLPAAETCQNAIDDDCDGAINEEGDGCVCLPNEIVSCYTGPAGTENVGTCKSGTKQCDALGTAFGPCTGDVLPAAEDCAQPGDEDCDGQIDEAEAGCACAPGSSQACYGGPAGTEGVGPCQGGTQVCNPDGLGYGPCVGQVVPEAETCLNAIDDDCDGQVNEGGTGCVCPPSSVTTCYGGPPGTEGVGVCAAGTKQCNALGTQYGPCMGEVLPSPETCNTPVDDDCDGQINEGGAGCVCAPGSSVSCYSGPFGTQGVGICQAGTQQCNALGTQYGPCMGEVLPSPETCNTPVDDDCDGQVNEGGAGCVCPPNLASSCYTGPAGTEGVGACTGGAKVCNAQGTAYGPCMGEVLPTTETCTTAEDDDCDGQVNESGTGCICVPGSTMSCYTGPPGTLNVGLCTGGTQTCNATGTAWGACTGQVTPQPESCLTPTDDDCNGSNLVCSGSQECYGGTGACISACAPELIGTSYVGCEYYPTVTANSLLQSTNLFTFAVAVANTSNKIANVTITKGAVVSASGAVAANSVQIFNLPWVNDLRTGTAATIKSLSSAGNGAYRLVSDRPVTVYQYNPLQYAAGATNSYTNDASLLLPVNAWTGNYRVASRNTWQGYPGFYAVVASQDATTVTLGPSPTGNNVRAGAGVAANGTGVVTLNKGDVLQVVSNGNGAQSDPSDLTGTLVTADKPVQVIGGHNCTFIPFNVGYCDHLEESMPPIETLATTYIVTAPLITAGTPKAQRVRIIATQPNTTLTYEPAQAGAPASIATAGAYVELPQTTNNYRITASAKILVSQYMLGQDAGGGSGDPAMALAVATEQYRTNYLFHTPTNYQTNFVNVTAPTGAAVTLDGAVIPAGSFTAIGATGFSLARVQLSNAGNGNHSITAAVKFGISAYGYGQYTSYWYPGGLDLNVILDP